jgi:hypothetical protein
VSIDRGKVSREAFFRIRCELATTEAVTRAALFLRLRYRDLLRGGTQCFP